MLLKGLSLEMKTVSQLSSLSDEAQRRLRWAGWYPGRRADVTSAKQEMTRLGMSLTASNEAVLQELYGLELTSFGGPDIRFRLGRIGLLTPVHVGVLRALAQEEIYPISSTDLTVKFLGESWKVHGIDWDWSGYETTPSLDDWLCGRLTGRRSDFSDAQLAMIPDKADDMGPLCEMIASRRPPFDAFDSGTSS